MEAQVEFLVPGETTTSLRARALSEVVDWTSGERLAASWHRLLAGCSRIVAEHSDKTHHYLELAATRAEPLSPREVARWRPTLLGSSQKVVAADTGCSNSSVASAGAHCLRVLGLNRTAREAPLLLAMMAHASESLDATGTRRRGYGEPADSIIISALRPDLALAKLLSPSELEVIQLRVDGLSHVQIAASRLTALRTVANQLASAYFKLGVSSRPELLAALIKGTWRREWRAQRADSKGNRLTYSKVVFATIAQ